MCVRVAIWNVHILYSKMGIDQMPNFKTQVYFTYLCYITFWALEFHFIENYIWFSVNQFFVRFLKLLFDLTPITAQYRTIFLKFFHKSWMFKNDKFSNGKIILESESSIKKFLQLNVLKIKSKINIKRI